MQVLHVAERRRAEFDARQPQKLPIYVAPKLDGFALGLQPQPNMIVVIGGHLKRFLFGR